MSDSVGLPDGMAGFVELQLIDDFLLNYNVGHAVLALFVLTVPLGIVKSSRKLLALIFIAFGGLFIAVPSIDADAGISFAMFGVVLMVVGPVLFSTAAR